MLCTSHKQHMQSFVSAFLGYLHTRNQGPQIYALCVEQRLLIDAVPSVVRSAV
jgi:hypothetical protein